MQLQLAKTVLVCRCGHLLAAMATALAKLLSKMNVVTAAPQQVQSSHRRALVLHCNMHLLLASTGECNPATSNVTRNLLKQSSCWLQQPQVSLSCHTCCVLCSAAAPN